MRTYLLFALLGLSPSIIRASPHGSQQHHKRAEASGVQNNAGEGTSSNTSSSDTSTPTFQAAGDNAATRTIEASSAITTSVASSSTPVTTSDALDHALKVVRDAQVEMAINNTYAFDNIRRNNYFYKPKSEQRRLSIKILGNGTMVPPAAVPAPVASAAAVVAEYLAANSSSKSPEHELEARQNGGSFWIETIAHSGKAFGAKAPGYKTYRNVKDYGAKGDGTTDDTAAINKAISEGNRCGENCGSSTVTPALVYFPAGKYLISSPIISYYNTQLVGNANDRPIIKASKAFVGLGAISSDVYIPGKNGDEWYINQNNFLRQVRNFVIDITDVPNMMIDPVTHWALEAKPCAIHWQVAQATSLQNIKMIMSTAKDSTHIGIFMENGSGGYIGDLEFQGGNIGAVFGNQQFTMRGLTFKNCPTAIKMLWDWGFTMSNFNIENCNTGIILTGGSGGKDGKDGQGIGSLMLIDSSISNTPIGIQATFSSTATQLVLENVKLNNVPIAVQGDTGGTMLPGGTKTIDSFVSGKIYSDSLSKDGKTQLRGSMKPIPSPPSKLRGPNGWFGRSKPQYEKTPASGFWDVKARSGAKGDGSSDDTAALNKAFADATKANMIVYMPFGMYMVSDTVTIPKGAKVVGELWSQIMAFGPVFSDIKRPRVVVKVGNEGDVGSVEIQDIMVTVRGATAGAILMQWNIAADKQGSAAMWDTHFRVGGAIGSNLQAGNCPKLTNKINEACIAASLLFHMTPKSNGYFENIWAWTADHDMDIVEQTQIDIYVGRGMLIESQGPTWLWGSASEHNVLYQYQLENAKDIWLGMIQTESPYYQGISSPDRNNAQLVPFNMQRGAVWYGDPSFSNCNNKADCLMSWAVRILQSESIWMYGAGLYSWFQKYDQPGCLPTETCQRYMFDLDDQSNKNIWLYNIVTKGAIEMITPVSSYPALAMDNKNGFTSSVMAYVVNSGKDYISEWTNFGARMGKMI